MKLIYLIVRRLSVALLVIMAGWAVGFYVIITAEINDETDDSLEDYAHDLIARKLAGEALPALDNGTNNTYHLEEVTPEYASGVSAVRYTDETMWIASRMETEPARVLRTVFHDGEDRIFELTVAIPSYEKNDLQRRILIWILVLYTLLLGCVLAVNAWIVKRSFRPLYALLEWLPRVRPGEDVPSLDVKTDITEFRLLTEAMEKSAKRAEKTFEEQRLFTGNAAHELQTPIAVCRGRLELLASDGSLSEGQLEQIGAVMGTLDRLAGLNRTLLMLTRIDNGSFPDSTQVDAGEILRRLVEDYQEVYGHKHLAVHLHETAPFVPEMNETLAGVLWGNLLKNAFVHTPEGGTIEVRVSARGVSVANTASAGPLDPVVIFRRFYRGAGTEGSSGLGLALVESIGRLYKLHIGYDFSEGRHIFSVTF
jgi:signal transduction histidine kinase